MKQTPKKTPAKKAPAKKAPAKRAPAKRAPAKRAPAKRAPAKRAPIPAKEPTLGQLRIREERARQVQQEGYNEEHDDIHCDGELESAAAAYVKEAARQVQTNGNISTTAPEGWPWTASWWKPEGGPARLYGKAGALYQAALDRLRREFARKPFLNSAADCSELNQRIHACALAIEYQEGKSGLSDCL